jgi:hypothetical protein
MITQRTHPDNGRREIPKAQTTPFYPVIPRVNDRQRDISGIILWYGLATVLKEQSSKERG